jgi:hypothetical protein
MPCLMSAVAPAMQQSSTDMQQAMQQATTRHAATT